MELHGTDSRISYRRLLPALTVAGATLVAAVVNAQPAKYEDVVRNLRNPDPKVRLAAVKLLREAKYPEAIVPVAALVGDPLDPIQLEAINAELAFFLVQDVPESGIGSGLSTIEAGLRLRYEIVREFAPYVGFNWERRFGDTARYARLAGEDVTSMGFVAGIRFWF